MAPSLRVPSTHREREASPPRSSTTLTPSDDERDATDQPSHERLSEDVTATPSRDERSISITAKHFAEDISDTARPSPWSKKILLALDGGGVRGYSSLLILEELLGIIARLESGNEEYDDKASPGKRLRFWPPHSSSREYPWHSSHDDKKDENEFLIHHYFDYVAGTSTGGLSAIMLSRMKMGITNAKDQYDVVGNSVFGKPRHGYRNKHYAKVFGGLRRAKYRTEQMETALQEVVKNGAQPESERTDVPATSIVLSNENNRACQTAVIADNIGGPIEGPYTFRSYDHPRPVRLTSYENRRNFGDFGPAHRVKLWEVARATSAAPFYFEKMVIGDETFQDGGIGTNNPASRIAKEIWQMHGNKFPTLILSIGTGSKTNRPAGSRRRHFKHARDLFDLMGRMKNIMTDSEDIHERLQTRVNDIHSGQLGGSVYPMYFRFNAPGIDHIALDEWNPPAGGKDTLDVLRTTTRAYLDKPIVQERLKECAIELVRLRRQRIWTERWEQYATDIVYGCPIIVANRRRCTALGFPSRDKLRRHLFECHEYVTWATMDGNWCCTIGGCVERPTRLVGSSEIEREENFRRHLREVHRFDNPTCMTVPQLEHCLDTGRTTRADLIRRESDRTNDPQQQGVQRDDDFRHQRDENGASSSASRDIEAGNAIVSRRRWRVLGFRRQQNENTRSRTSVAQSIV